jgi:hypothetical protein
MPTFYTEDVDIDPEEFVDSCSTYEKKELVKILAKEGYSDTSEVDSNSPLEIEHMDKCDLLANRFYSMSSEDLELLETLYNKYR